LGGGKKSRRMEGGAERKTANFMVRCLEGPLGRVIALGARK